MTTLKVIDGSEMTEYVVKLLNNNKISSVVQFVQEDSIKLCKITNLSLREVINIKKLLIKEHGVRSVTGFQLYQNLHRKFSHLPSGIKSLDDILEGGFAIGNLIEIVGLPASGKTQTCHTIAINASQDLNIESLYIDTKRDFSSARVHGLLKTRGCSESEIGFIMERIKVEKVYSAENLIHMLKELHRCVKKNFKNLKIVIIDSLPSIWFLFHGEKHNEGIKLLVEAANLMRRLANEHQLTIILVNIVTRWMEISLEENESTKSQTIKPSLGKYWQTVPSVRLLIEREEDAAIHPETTSTMAIANTPAATATLNRVIVDDIGKPRNRSHARSIKIIKSDLHEIGKCCRVCISEKGVIAAAFDAGGDDDVGSDVGCGRRRHFV